MMLVNKIDVYSMDQEEISHKTIKLTYLVSENQQTSIHILF